MSDKISFLDIHSNESYKVKIIDSLCYGIKDCDELCNILTYVIDSKYHLFDLKELEGSLYDDEDEILDLVLPSIRRLYGCIFISPPTLFDGKRLELLKIYFDIDIFIDYLIKQLLISKHILKEFKYLDKTKQTLELIVDNYIAELVTKVLECNNYIQEVRDIKINRIC